MFTIHGHENEKYKSHIDGPSHHESLGGRFIPLFETGQKMILLSLY